MALIAALAAGCGGDSKEVPLPSSSGTAGASTPATPEGTPEQAVSKVYTDSYKAARDAIFQPSEKVRSFLAAYYVGEYLDSVVRSVLLAQEQDMVPWGNGIVVHIKKVTVNGAQATVDDCRDASDAGLKSRKTGKLSADTRGTNAQQIVAKLAKGGEGQWRITDVQKYPKPCSRS
ncbi:hypothetical protein OHR68_00710 [Spirillospora sp. NBC_00431]